MWENKYFTATRTNINVCWNCFLTVYKTSLFMQCMYFVYLQNMSTVLKYNKICLIDSCWFNRGRYPLSCRNYDINLIHLIVCILMVGFCVYDRENYLDWAVICSLIFSQWDLLMTCSRFYSAKLLLVIKVGRSIWI